MSSNKSTLPFALIHCDLWGPYRTSSHSGAYSFLTIVDDHTRATWVYLMRYKSKTHHYLTCFLAMVRTQFNYSIQQIRSDNGLEFFSNPMQDFFNHNGIVHQHSCVNTPQQNGVVEHKHRHLLNFACALRFQAHLPISFWGVCVLTVAYLINYTPTPLLSGKSPYEVLFHRTPFYFHLRVFGCLCYAHDNHKHKDKFFARAQHCVFVGYPFGQKGYRLFNLHIKRIFTSRDVSFYENQFHFQQTSGPPNPSTSSVVPLPINEPTSCSPSPISPSSTLVSSCDAD